MHADRLPQYQVEHFCRARTSFSLAVDIVLRLQSLYIVLQVGFVGIGRRCEGSLHFFDSIVEIPLAAVNPRQA